MYNISIDNTIAQQPCEGLQIKQLVKKNRLEVLSVSLEKGAVFPSHESYEDAHLIMLQGQICFYMEGNPILLKSHQHFSFEKNKRHWVEALKDSKFLIIR